MYSLLNRCSNIAKLLIISEIDIYSINSYNRHGVLTIVSYDGNFELVKLLLEKGINDITFTKPLPCALYAGHKNDVELLLDYGANINFQDNLGNMSLILAFRFNNYLLF